MCLPVLRGPAFDFGLVHTTNDELSSWHKKVTLDWASEKLKLALVWLVVLGGAEVITGLGGAVVSMLHEKVAGELWLPAVSCAFTANVCVPWMRPD